jgi:hypothetical protein
MHAVSGLQEQLRFEGLGRLDHVGDGEGEALPAGGVQPLTRLVLTSFPGYAYTNPGGLDYWDVPSEWLTPAIRQAAGADGFRGRHQQRLVWPAQQYGSPPPQFGRRAMHGPQGEHGGIGQGRRGGQWGVGGHWDCHAHDCRSNANAWRTGNVAPKRRLTGG